MANITVAKLLHIAPGAAKARNLDKLVTALDAACHRYGISNTPRRLRYFLAQVAHESAEFTKLAESLYYTDPVRVATIFRWGFDLDKDRVVDPEEVELAKQYLRNSEKMANRVYAGRLGNGDEASGDGFKYRGRGLIQLTFLKNYHRASFAVYGDDRLVRTPDLVCDDSDYEAATLTAAEFWHSNGLNPLSDADQFTEVTRRVHGDVVTAPARKVYLARANQLDF